MKARTDTTGADTAPPSSPLIPSTVLFGNPQRVSPALSPDGQGLAWLAPGDGVLYVWVRDLHGAPGAERVVTCDRDRGVQTSPGSPTAAASWSARTRPVMRTGDWPTCTLTLVNSPT